MSQSSVDIQIEDEDSFQVSAGCEDLVNGNLFNPIQLDAPTSMERWRQFCFAISRPEPGKLSRQHGPNQRREAAVLLATLNVHGGFGFAGSFECWVPWRFQVFMKSSRGSFSVKETASGVIGSATTGFMRKGLHVFVDIFGTPDNRESKGDDDF